MNEGPMNEMGKPCMEYSVEWNGNVGSSRTVKENRLLIYESDQKLKTQPESKNHVVTRKSRYEKGNIEGDKEEVKNWLGYCLRRLFIQEWNSRYGKKIGRRGGRKVRKDSEKKKKTRPKRMKNTKLTFKNRFYTILQQ